jgi:2-dehydropantoate 2-reductase
MAAVTSDPDNLALLANLSGEVIRTAEKEGVVPVGFDGFEPDAMRFGPDRDWTAIRASWTAVSKVTARSSKPKSGIWIDLAVRKCRTEVDDMIGQVARIARLHSTPLPLLERLIEIVHEIERGEHRMGVGNLAALRALSERTYP